MPKDYFPSVSQVLPDFKSATREMQLQVAVGFRVFPRALLSRSVCLHCVSRVQICNNITHSVSRVLPMQRRGVLRWRSSYVTGLSSQEAATFTVGPELDSWMRFAHMASEHVHLLPSFQVDFTRNVERGSVAGRLKRART